MTKSEANRSFSIVVDPSAILSYEHLQDLMKALEDLSEQGVNLKVLLPNDLHSNLNKLESGLQEEQIEFFEEIYQTFLPSDSPRNAQQSLRDLSINNEYKQLIREFREKYSPENTEKYAYAPVDPAEQRLIDKLFTRDQLDHLLSSTPNSARILYEELSTSAKIKAAITGPLEKFVGLLKRLGKSIINARNKFKEALKKRKNITRALVVFLSSEFHPKSDLDSSPIIFCPYVAVA